MQGLKEGEHLEVTASDPGFAQDISSWCRATGNTLVENREEDKVFVALLRKGSAPESGQKVVPAAAVQPQGKTLVVFDGDLDKVLAAFVIANGALALGRPVTMFFTFWGLNALRKSPPPSLSKSLLERAFGWMLPCGPKELKLSRLNMGGLGTALMRRIMRDKNISSLEEMMRQAMTAGVRIIACSMSMEVMGIRKEELIDGVEIGGVGAYLASAEEANVNLFL